MDFVIGGVYQNKKEFVQKKYGISQQEMVSCLDEIEKVLEAQCLYEFTDMIRDCVMKNRDYEELVNKIIKESKCLVLIADEVGCGIVPIRKEDRIYREAAGRMMCNVAKEAENVYRVMCGIGTKIK